MNERSFIIPLDAQGQQDFFNKIVIDTYEKIL
jgi:hypothetical protein